MGTVRDHRRCAEECVAMARLCEGNKDKSLWLTLAQSWLRLAEHVARAQADCVAETAALDAKPSQDCSRVSDQASSQVA